MLAMTPSMYSLGWMEGRCLEEEPAPPPEEEEEGKEPPPTPRAPVAALKKFWNNRKTFDSQVINCLQKLHSMYLCLGRRLNVECLQR